MGRDGIRTARRDSRTEESNRAPLASKRQPPGGRPPSFAADVVFYILMAVFLAVLAMIFWILSGQ